MADVTNQATPDEIEQEKEHFQAVVNAFLYYKKHALLKLQRTCNHYRELPEAHKQMLIKFPGHLDDVRQGIEENYKFVRRIVSSAVGMFENSEVSHFDSSVAMEQMQHATEFMMEKVKTTIKQFYRDWSAEGSHERELCYKPIIDEIISIFPPDKITPSDVAILVPGAGLGRLAHELASLGYRCEGNEFSMFMLLASNFILNQACGTHTHTIYPWVLQSCNNLSYEHQVAKVTIPDVSPSSIPQYGLFSMCAGDFLEVYTTPNSWDCLACCFFIDTAHNVIDYLQTIHKVLKPGGYWINFGPLLYHFAGMPNEFSIEPSWDDIRRIATEEIGFEILVSALPLQLLIIVMRVVPVMCYLQKW